jgi:hypothetical protein
LKKKQEFEEQIVNTLVVIQGTRWSGSGLIISNNYSLHYRGSNETGQAGSGSIVIKKALKYILGNEP